MDGSTALAILDKKINSVESTIQSVTLGSDKKSIVITTVDGVSFSVSIPNAVDNPTLLNKFTVVNGEVYYDGKRIAEYAEIPTATSQLTNDSGFIVSIPSEYVTETELSAKGYVTETYVQNKIAEASLSGGEVDLSGYATKDDLNTKADKTAIPTKASQLTNDKGYLTSIPSEYVTETELSAKGYLTDHQDISMKADKTELHSHSNKTVLDGITSTKVTEWNNKSNFDGNYNSLTNKPTIPTVDVNKSYVDTELSKKSDKTHNHDTVYAPINHEHSQYLTSVPSEYVTDEELNAKGYLTSHQDISGKADKSYVDTQLSKKSDTTHNHSYNDLTDNSKCIYITCSNFNNIRRN